MTDTTRKDPHATETLKWIYSRMTLIREFEERVCQDYTAGKVTGAVHLYSGQEAVAVGVCAHLRDDDYITSTHRGHGHCIAKGLEPKLMMAELHGKVTGLCKGKGGSMHLTDSRLGMLGANGIVPAGLPLACGAALSAKVRKTDQVAVAFFGDGGSNAGGFHESLNLAAVLKLPVVFVLENNGYADATSIRYGALIENLAERAQSYGIPGMTIDGSDVFAVFDAAGAAVTDARHHKRPMLLECKTYRYHGHCIGDLAPYRSTEEVEQERKRDCIAGFENKVRVHGWLSDDTLSQIKMDSIEQVRDAVRFAEESPCPKPDEYLEDVYVSY